MKISWSDIMAAAALVLSIYTLFQTSRYRREDQIIAATRERAEMREMLIALQDAPRTLKSSWKAAFAARGVLESTMRAQKEAELDGLSEKISALYTELGSVPQFDRAVSTINAERVLTQLVSLRARVDAIARLVEAEEEQIKENQGRLTTASR